MSEQFAYECQHCGTAYNHPQANCPYCGEPQYFSAEELELYAASQQDYVETLEEAAEQVYYDDDPYAAHDYESDEPTHEEFHYHENYLPEEEPYADDIYAAAGQGNLVTPNIEAYLDPSYSTQEDLYDDPTYVDDPYHDYHEDYPHEHEDYGYVEHQAADEPYYDEAETEPRRFTFRRVALGCLGLIICVGLFYGGLGLLAVRQGLQERAVLTQDESNDHYEKGLEYMASNELDLAIAEFELSLNINPTNPQVRDALRDAQQLAQSQPTPTSETRSAAAADLLDKAQEDFDNENWEEAITTLTDIQDLDAEYETDTISDLIYEASYNLGLQHVENEEIEEAQLAFERALVERPNDPEAVVEQTKALLYLEGVLVQPVDPGQAVNLFSQIYDDDQGYVDVKERYRQTLEQYGDALFEEKEWCQAEVQYLDAQEVEPSRLLETKIDNVTERCQEDAVAQRSTPNTDATDEPDDGDSTATTNTRSTATPATSSTASASLAAEANTSTTNEAEPTEEATEEAANETAPAADTSLGSIVYSKYNPAETRWEIVSIPAAGGTPKVLVTDGQMPSVSLDGSLLLYRTDLQNSIGLHLYNLTNGQDDRITIYQEHISPKWGPGDTDYIFSAQELGTGRWQIFQGFADGKGNPNILGDGRTPAWSPKGDLIAYQGTDAQGNNPGIYVVPFGGGDHVRLSTHESDRSPAFSPNGSQVAYMSTRSGNWDIFAVSTDGGGTPRQVTTSPGNDGLPTWSPDGSEIAYVSDTGGRWGIYRISAQGGTPVRITDWDGLKQEDWLMAQIWWTR
ncbi:MAG: PD40 domain-containing protein [Anaerolineae bacterium]|nr:PD40 domain-containing protein [Anaerolineae bacterium]